RLNRTVRSRFLRIALARVIAALAIPACASAASFTVVSAGAAEGWQPPIPVADNASLPRVGADGQGNAIATWLSESHHHGQVAFAPAGGAFGDPITLSALDVHSEQRPQPKIAVDAAGDAVVVWN